MIENAGIDYKELYLKMQSAVVALSKTLEEIQKENKNLKEENEYLKRKLFGTKSETSKSLGFEQLSLFDEAEAEANPDEEQFILEAVKCWLPNYLNMKVKNLIKLNKKVIAQVWIKSIQIMWYDFYNIFYRKWEKEKRVKPTHANEFFLLSALTNKIMITVYKA